MQPKTKILLVDDCTELLTALKGFLEIKTYEVCTVGSYKLLQEAMEHFVPDIIVLDIHLGGKLDGRDICRLLKSSHVTAHIPILLMSGYTDLLQNYKECLADAILEKPFNLWTLQSKIDCLINEQVEC